MKRVACFTVAMVLSIGVLAAAEQAPLTELGKKVMQSLGSDKWNYACKTFVWEDYLGAFGCGTDSAHSFLKVTKDEADRFYVKLEGHIIPAVRMHTTVYRRA